MNDDKNKPSTVEFAVILAQNQIGSLIETLEEIWNRIPTNVCDLNDLRDKLESVKNYLHSEEMEYA